MKKICYRSILLAGFLCLLAFGAPAAARERVPPAFQTSTAIPADLDDRAGLEAFLDGFFYAVLASHHIPGAVISVVKDGELFFSKGYGYADIDDKIPVDPGRTLFRPGSVSKLFVWTSVMQLVERGQLKLTDDVRTLVDVRLPRSCRQPITLEHLMSHTPGFEDMGLGLFVRFPDDLQPLAEFLRQHPPECLYTPGEVPAYSNYGTALAAYLVERTTGLPFYTYVEDNIFKPLGMTRSTFRQPVPPDLADDLAWGYGFVQGGYTLGAFEVVNAYPAGSLSATAEDMARFMIAHLQNGRYGETSILKDTTARMMHAQHFTFDTRASGWAHGFMEMKVNGQRLITHGGDTFLFHSLLALIPEQNIGLFVSFNAAGGLQARNELLQAFMDRYFPLEPAPPAGSPDDSTSGLAQIAGEYYPSRRNTSTLEKLLVLMQPVTISVSTDGSLMVNIANVEQSQWVEVEPYVFKNRFNSEHIYFQHDDNGVVTAAILQNNPSLIVFKTPWYATVTFSAFLLLAALLLGLTVLTYWPVMYFTARPYLVKEPHHLRGLANLARWVAFGFYLVTFLLVIGFLIGFGQINPAYQIPELYLGVPGWFETLLWLPWILAILAVAMVLFLVMAWTGIGDDLQRPYWGLAGRLHYTLVTLVAAGLVWFCYYWNLIAGI